MALAVFAVRIAPVLLLLFFLVPVLCGLAATVLPAFGYLPALKLETLSLTPWRALFALPYLSSSLKFSFVSGMAALGLSCLLVFAAFSAFSEGRVMRLLRRTLAPLLSVPHAAVALGIGFLFAPSGWLLRLVSPELTGFTEPPTWVTNPDPYGILYTLALIAKETPFLFLMALSAHNADNSARTLMTAQCLGYARPTAYAKALLETIYKRMRLPIYAVLAFSMSNLEVALTLASTSPRPFALLVLDLYNAPDLQTQTTASAAALLQVGVVGVGILLWEGAMQILFRAIRLWRGGRRGGGYRVFSTTAAAAVISTTALGLLAVVVLPIWAFARVWRFPAIFPQVWSLELWTGSFMRLAEPWGVTLLVALAASLGGVLLVVACLENETRRAYPASTIGTAALYVPLVVPQISFLFGIQILLFVCSVPIGLPVVIWSHMVFVLPYMFLSLAQVWRGLDTRYRLSAQTLGRSDNGALFFVTLPLMLRPLATAIALGVAVSVALYAPTVLVGAGRFNTLTSEAVALSAGGDRRLIGGFALLQAVTPCFFFMLALALPRILWRKRSFMAGLYG